MINVIKNYTSQTYQSLPKIHLDKPKNTARKISALALPAILLVTLASLSTVTAPNNCIECMNACDAIEPPMQLICYGVCVFFVCR